MLTRLQDVTAIVVLVLAVGLLTPVLAYYAVRRALLWARMSPGDRVMQTSGFRQDRTIAEAARRHVPD